MNPLPESQPRRRVGAGPKVLTFSGIALLLVAIAAGVAAVLLFVRVVPLDLVTASGEPGPGALGAVDVPGSATVDLPDDGIYSVWEVGPDPVSQGMSAEDVTVTVAGDDAGTSLAVGRPEMSGQISVGGLHGRLLAQFESEAETVDLSAGDPGVPDGTYLVVARGQDFGGFFTGVGGTIGAWFVAIGGGMLGFAMTIGGVIWWVVRRNSARPPAQAPPTTGPARATP
ncbi:hypothetical protein GCM10027059_14360 [Myceligenerans halotolerans]